MPKYVIERDVSGVGKLAANQLRDLSQKSCAVIKEMNAKVQWIHSYVTDDRIYCIYLAPDIDSLREHARNGGFPANRISEIRSIIDPGTAES